MHWESGSPNHAAQYSLDRSIRTWMLPGPTFTQIRPRKSLPESVQRLNDRHHPKPSLQRRKRWGNAIYAKTECHQDAKTDSCRLKTRLADQRSGLGTSPIQPHRALKHWLIPSARGQSDLWHNCRLHLSVQKQRDEAPPLRGKHTDPDITH